MSVDKLLDLGEAAEMFAEDVQVFAGQLERTNLANLTGPEALRLYGKRLAHLGVDLHRSTLGVFDREPMRLRCPEVAVGRDIAGDFGA